jgi:hypothetical protein
LKISYKEDRTMNRKNFNVYFDEKTQSRYAMLEVVEYKNNNGSPEAIVIDSCQWALDNSTIALDYLTIKKMMIMNLEGKFPEVSTEQQVDEPEPQPQVQTQFQRRNEAIQQVRHPNGPMISPDNTSSMTKKILDAVESHQTVIDFPERKDFYSWMDKNYGNGGFQSAPKLNSLNVAQLKDIYRVIMGL